MWLRVWHSPEYTAALRTVGGHRNAVYFLVQPLLLKPELKILSSSNPAPSVPLWYILKTLHGTSLTFKKSRLKLLNMTIQDLGNMLLGRRLFSCLRFLDN